MHLAFSPPTPWIVIEGELVSCRGEWKPIKLHPLVRPLQTNLPPPRPPPASGNCIGHGLGDACVSSFNSFEIFIVNKLLDQADYLSVFWLLFTAG